MYKVLIVEDDATIASLLCECLSRWGYEARAADDFQHVLDTFRDFDPQLVLLDISLPFYDGFHWCREIRLQSNVPVLFLSSRGDNMDIVMAMNMGGDDYVQKPFSMEVLLAKISALLRRAYRYPAAPPALAARGAELDPQGAALRYGGRQIELTRNEYRILGTLLQSKNAVVSREELMRALWDDDSFVDDNTLTVAYLSDDEYRRRYELDLVKEMAHQRKGNKIAVVYNHDCEGIEELADYPVQIKVGADMENVLLGLDFILFAQTIALMKSLSLGITPDNPCPTGEVNRVVKGVTLYPYTLK